MFQPSDHSQVVHTQVAARGASRRPVLASSVSVVLAFVFAALIWLSVRPAATQAQALSNTPAGLKASSVSLLSANSVTKTHGLPGLNLRAFFTQPDAARLPGWLTKLEANFRGAAINRPFYARARTDARSAVNIRPNLPSVCASVIVTNTDDSGPGSLRDIIACAAVGDTITFDNSLADQTIFLTSGALSVSTPDLTIDGSTAPGVKVDGGGIDRVFDVGVPLSINALTIQNGYANGDGGGIGANDALTLTNVSVLTSTAEGYGGGVSAPDTLYMTGTLLSGNTAHDSGGGLVVNFATVINSNFISNTADSFGGGAAFFLPSTLSGGSFERNAVITTTGSFFPGGLGGGVFAADALDVIGTRFLSNTSTFAGGGLGTFDLCGCGGITPTVTNANFIANTAEWWGGGAAIIFEPATLDGGVFEGNAVLTDTFSYPLISLGGGAFALGPLTVTGTQFLSNTSPVLGGGLGTFDLFGSIGVTATITNATFIANTAVISVAGAGGAFFFGPTSVSGSSFARNTTDGIGGGVIAGDMLTVTDSEFVGNSADAGGALAQVPLTGNPGGSVINTLFAGNWVTGTDGAALYLDSIDPVFILHTTIASPTVAISNSAIYINSGDVIIGDSIVTSYSIGIDNNTGNVFEDYNLFFANGTNLNGSIGSGGHDQSGDPLFIDPASNNYHLGAGSPAIDTGLYVGVNHDVDGDPRPIGGGVDIGYDEAVGCTLVTNTADDGTGSLRNAIACAQPNDTISFAGSLANQTILLTTTEIVVTQTNLTIDGSNAAGVRVDGNNAMRVFSVTAPLTINALTIQNGNSADDGGGLYTTDALTLTNVNVLSNTAVDSGGGVFAWGAVTLNGGLFQNNQCTGSLCLGGGLYAANTLDLSDTQFLANTASSAGGAVTVGAATFNGGLFQNNRTFDSGGGGVWAVSTLALTGTQFISNSGLGGGGMRTSGAATLNGGLFQSNTSPGSVGGGLYADTALVITGTQFISNTAGDSGGGVQASGVVTLTGGLFQGNVVTSTGGIGGGLYTGDTLNLTGTQFISNTAGAAGGGLYKEYGSSSVIQAALFQYNHAGDDGGGLNVGNELKVSILANRFLNNDATNGGGGLYVGSGGGSTSVTALNNNFFGGNTSANGAADVGLGTTVSSAVTGRYNTFASATVGSGTAVSVGSDGAGDNLSLINSIFDGYNIAAKFDTFGGTITFDGVLWHDVTQQMSGGVVGLTNDITGTPEFVDRANGDLHIGPESAAIDRAVSTSVSTDIDGDYRPQGTDDDLGADEVLQYCDQSLQSNTDYPLFSTPPITVSFSAPGDIYCLAAVYFPRGHDHATGTVGHGVGADHFWQIAARDSDGLITTGFSATLTVPVGSLTNPSLCFYPGGLGGSGWDCGGTDNGNGTITRSGLTHFSDWAVGNAGPTAVGLKAFEATSADRSVARFASIGTVALLLMSIGAAIVIRRRRIASR